MNYFIRDNWTLSLLQQNLKCEAYLKIQSMSIDAWGVLPRKFLKFSLTLNLALILAENNSLINAIIISWL